MVPVLPNEGETQVHSPGRGRENGAQKQAGERDPEREGDSQTIGQRGDAVIRLDHCGPVPVSRWAS